MSSSVATRERLLLEIVEDGGGERDARTIDVLMSSQHGPSETTVRSELLALAGRGLVQQDDNRGVGGMWSLTSEGRAALADTSAD